MSVSRLEYLFQRYIDQTCTAEEQQELMQLLQLSANNAQIKDLLDQVFNNMVIEHRLQPSKADVIFRNILTVGNAVHEAPVQPSNNIPVRRLFTLTRVAVAAAVLLIVTTGMYFLLNRTPALEITKTENNNRFKNDIAPGKNSAVLTLADGSVIQLDQIDNGTSMVHGNASFVKEEGQVKWESAYANPGSAGTADKSAVAFNTLTTPKGGQYQLLLPDGSKVWLNAASTIRFPAAFSGNERKVEVNGEAYFEVATLRLQSGQKMPFRVNINNKAEVEVLGTHFNINAYDNEGDIKTTLLEGKVKVVSRQSAYADPGSAGTADKSAILKPGEQASISHSTPISVYAVDTDASIAWKNGQFMFEGNQIQSVMRQLERWYNIEVTYADHVTKEEFVGAISRNENISAVLGMLEQTGIVHFEINGRKVLVK